MSVQVKRRRDTAATVAAYVGAQGELIVDTTNNRVTVHDGATAGGFAAAKLSEVITNGRTAVSDAAYTVLATDRSVAYTALTAARAVTLPAASAYPTGTALTIFDESGNCSTTNALTIARSGSDTIDGATSASIATAYGYLALESNGSGKWTVIDQALGASALQQVAQGANGAAIQFQVIEQTVTLSGASTTAVTPIPANCIVLGVGARVLSSVTGAPSFGVGVSGTPTQFGGALNVALGSTNFGIVGPYGCYSATYLIVTATSGSFTGGSVRLSLKILLLPVSTS
ncbi:hypothetical protein [Rhodoblastus sp.]|jgi:hypothetical protein|uniref:hyaluronate lyase N-terminal domain-containing protein n=1 Tax=Rhodoblastus sp. TaxID=1962975 RepID=UPI0025D9BDA7|nr:hypothetical protein [Rhodoblastus sp.]